MKNKHYKVKKVKDIELEDFLNDNYHDGYELKIMQVLDTFSCYHFCVVLEKKEDK